MRERGLPSRAHRCAQDTWRPRSAQFESCLVAETFGAVVAEQGELIDRIDADAEASLGLLGEAHSQILGYQRTLSGNRGLMLKAFGVIFFVVIVYGTISYR